MTLLVAYCVVGGFLWAMYTRPAGTVPKWARVKPGRESQGGFWPLIISLLSSLSSSNQQKDKQTQSAAGGGALPAETGSGGILSSFLSGALGTPVGGASQSPTLGQGLSSRDVAAMKANGVTITDQPIGAGEQSLTGAKVGAAGKGGQMAGQIGSIVGALASRPQQAPAGASVAPLQTNSLSDILSALGVRAMAEGGLLRPGETAIVGEQGPEVIEDTPSGTAVKPLDSAATPAEVATVAEPQAAQQGLLGKVADTALNDVIAPIILGRLGLQQHFDAQKQAEAQRQQVLAKSAIEKPELLEQAPESAKAVDAVYGAGTAGRIRQANDPDQQALAFGRRNGVKFITPGTTLPSGEQAPNYSTQLVSALSGQGQYSVNSKGIMTFKTPSVSKKDLDEQVVNNVMQQLVDKGIDEREAATQAAAWGRRAGYLPGKEILDIALGSTMSQVLADRASMEAQARKDVEIGGARQLNEEQAIGTGLGQARVRRAAPQTEADFLNNAQEDKLARLKTSPDPEDQKLAQELGGLSKGEQALKVRQGLDLQPAPASAVDKITANENMLKTGEEVLRLFDPKKVGLVAGRTLTLKQFLSRMGVEEAQFKNAVGRLYNARRMVITKSQASDKELSRIERDTLSLNMNPAAFVSYLAGAMREAAYDHATLRGLLKQNGNKAPADYHPSDDVIAFMKNPGIAIKNQWRHQFNAAFDNRFESYLTGRPPKAKPPKEQPPPAKERVATPAGGAPATAAAPNQMSSKQTTAAKQVGGTLKNYAAELERAMKEDGLAPETAQKMLQRAQDSGMPLE